MNLASLWNSSECDDFMPALSGPDRIGKAGKALSSCLFFPVPPAGGGLTGKIPTVGRSDCCHTARQVPG
ncbi:hypothetical protein RZS08_17085, partial [Arthrospira platensis SPKY1]|nr:hypothetical protein [Arthrospira platensis SPKY1]